MARGPESVLTEFIHDLKSDRPDTTIDTIEIIEDIALPSPFDRIAEDDVKEYMGRFDKGIGILNEITIQLENHTGSLNEHTTLLQGMNNKLDVLNSVNDKLDSLPERIAEAMKK